MTTMSDQPQQKLLEILHKRGADLLQDPKLLEDLLRDHCAEYRPEVTALMNAHREGVPSILLTELGQTPEAILTGRLRVQLQTHQSMETEAARWAVDAWLGAIRPFTKQPGRPREATPSVEPWFVFKDFQELAVTKLREDPKGEFLLNLLMEMGADAGDAALAIAAARKQLAEVPLLVHPPKPGKLDPWDRKQFKGADPLVWWPTALKLAAVLAAAVLAGPPVFNFFLGNWAEISFAFNSGDFAGAFLKLVIVTIAGGALWAVIRIVQKVAGK